METITAVEFKKVATNGYFDLEIDLTVTGSPPAGADTSKTKLNYSIGLAYDDSTNSSAWKTHYGAHWSSTDNYVNSSGGRQAPLLRFDSLETYDLGMPTVGTTRTNIRLGFDPDSLAERAIANSDDIDDRDDFDAEGGYLISYISEKSGYDHDSNWTSLSTAQQDLWKRPDDGSTYANYYYVHMSAGNDYQAPMLGELSADDWNSWAYSEGFMGTGASTGSVGFVQLRYFDSDGDELAWGSHGSKIPGVSNPKHFSLVFKNGDIIYNADNPGATINPNNLPDNTTTVSTGSFPDDGSADYDIDTLSDATPSQVATKLLDEFDMTYAGGTTCDTDTFTNMSTANINRIKRKYTERAANSGDENYKQLRQDAVDAITVTEHNYANGDTIAETLNSYTSGLKQYKIAVDASEFSDTTANAVINSVTGAIKRVLQRELINLNPGIYGLPDSGGNSIPSVTAARNAHNESAITNQTVDKNCVAALLTDSDTATRNRDAGVYNVEAFIDALSDATDDGVNVHHMLTNVLKSSGSADASTMIYVNGGNIHIGIKRGLLTANNTPNNGTDAVGSAVNGQTISINTANALAEQIKDAAYGAIRQALLNSKF